MGVRLFQLRKPKIGGPLPPIVIFDAGISEDHSVENDVTTDPVEDQGFRTDGIITRPRVVRLTGVVSSHNPVNRGPGSLDIGGQFGAGVFSTRFSNRIHIEAWRQVVQLAKLKIPVDIVTPLERYSNMIPVGVRTTRTKEDGLSLLIDVEFQQFRLALVDDLANASGAASELGGEVEDLGAQGVNELADAIAGGAL